MPSKAWLKLSARGCLAAAAALPERLRAPLLPRVSAFLLLSADELLPPAALFFPEVLFFPAVLFEGLFEAPFEELAEELFEELFEVLFEELFLVEALFEALLFSSVLFPTAVFFIPVSAIKIFSHAGCDHRTLRRLNVGPERKKSVSTILFYSLIFSHRRSFFNSFFESSARAIPGDSRAKPGKVFDDFSRDDQPRHRWNKSQASRSGSAGSAVSGIR